MNINMKQEKIPITLEDKNLFVENNFRIFSFLYKTIIFFFIIFCLWNWFLKPFFIKQAIKKIKEKDRISINGIIGMVKFIDKDLIVLEINSNFSIKFVRKDILNITYIK